MHVQHAGQSKTMWVDVTMGREPSLPGWDDVGAGGAGWALAGTFKVQNVANTLWEAWVFSILRAPAERSLWMRVPSD